MARSLLLALGLLVVFAGVLALPALADDEPAEPPKAGETKTEEKKDELTLADIEAIVDKHPAATWILILGRLLPLLIGVILLVMLYLRQDKIRGGVIPADPPNPPPLPYEPQINLLLVLAGLVLFPFILALFYGAATGAKALPLPVSLVITGISSLPIAILVVMRRHRLAGERIPKAGRATSLGLWAFCLAIVAVIPLTMLWGVVLHAMGYTPPAQALVIKTAFDPDPLIPISIALFGVLIAPFVEESVFRGLLYPTVRKLCGDGKRGIWLSAVITSVIFAAVHWNVAAFFGLFALAMVLALVYEKTNSLAAVVIAHATNNLLTLIPMLMVRFG